MRLFVFIGALLTGLLLVVATVAVAHEHERMKYDWECCHDMDCAPVEKTTIEKIVETDKDGNRIEKMVHVYHIIIPDINNSTQKKIYSAPVDSLTKYKESKNNITHACINRLTNKLICIYLPGGN